MKNYKNVMYKTILVLFILKTNICYSQNFKYRKIPNIYYKNIKTDNLTVTEASELSKKGYQLVNSLPSNYDSTGKKDYTEIIQNVLNNYRIVVFPNFPLLINFKGLSISSNSILIFSKKSKIILSGNDKSNYEIIRIHNVKNVNLYFPTIIGDRNSHIGVKGEWGMGISIRGSENINVYSPVINNCWGDGIYLGTSKQINKNIFIKNAFLDNNRRNGMSIISVIGLNVENPLIANTNGTRPMAGVDFEPNTNLEDLQDITIKNPITYNNGLRGILFALNNLYGVNHKYINITIKNHIDDGSAYAIGLCLTKLKNEPTSKSNKGKVNGKIEIDNPAWKNNIKDPIQFYELFENNINVNLIEPKVYKGNIIDNSKILNLKQNLKAKISTKK